MRKSFFVEGLTATTVGAAGTSAPLDLTAPIVALVPEVAEEPTTLKKYSSILTEVTPEGGFKFLVDRKSHINKYNTSSAIHEAGSVGDATIGAVTTSGFKKSKRDKFEFEMNKSWDAGKAYDKKKDPKVEETKMLKDLGSLKNDLQEEKAADYYRAIDADINGAASKTYPTYVSSIDEKTVATPDILKTLALTEAKTLDELKLNAAKIVDLMFAMVTEQASMGRKGSTHQGYPYARGTRKKLKQQFTIKDDLVTLISHDDRYVTDGRSPEMIARGVVATINEVEIIKDDYMDSNAVKFDIELSGQGTYSPVIKGEELSDEFMLFDHPTKPEKSNLLSGSGGYDVFVTPFISLSRFMKVNIAATAADAPAVKSGK